MMRKAFQNSVVALVLLVGPVLLAGCSNANESKCAQPSRTTDHEGHDHSSHAH